MNNLLRITCLGDIAPVRVAASPFRENTSTVRKFFAETFSDSDIIFANLETPLVSTGTIREDKKYVLKADPGVLGVFPEKTVFSIANNHILDYRCEGLSETIAHLEEKGLRYAGAGTSLEAAGKPVVIDCKGKRIGFMACADRRYQAATENRPGVFPAIASLLVPRIKKLKAGADLVYISVHMGMEYTPVPTPLMQELAGECHRAGADVVFFHHAHCVSGYTLSGERATLWGLGNFLFPEGDNYPFKPWFEAAAWRLTHDHAAGRLDVGISPFFIGKNGLPETPDPETRKRILGRIEKISRQINRGKSLGWPRLKSILSISYLKIALANYADIVRRQGLTQLLRQVISSLKMHILKIDQHDND
jgi:hypothetical protein